MKYSVDVVKNKSKYPTKKFAKNMRAALEMFNRIVTVKECDATKPS